MFIAIEGLDGTGKSTLTKALAEHLGMEHLTTPSGRYKPVRKEIDRIHYNDPYARQLFYASTVMQLSNTVGRKLNDGHSVVVDRYWLSTQVYHHWKTSGNSLPLHDVEKKLIVPDLTVYIHVPYRERKKRLKSRESNTSEDIKTLSPSADSTLNEFYRLALQNNQVVNQWLEVDGKSPIELIVQRVCNELHL
ncbi:hypothetical protein GZ77_05155 [Endozoicomonas montiporae]|uniref:Thymidylate kinase-like domain-containing protein n=2 Tax=Endozoicomonas montiporae TaxID=1027273 RepID=A0A081NBS6_9GAMM|nr:deoxynucleoside kinase [Endozoicomonas montiporae]AMO56203.1 thymidylate kinase [Endozoicomonas montiporae CL-33]KEQ15899.1 hypothetical protein GZ77_05155 [Endozoicomonas montiporae]